MHMTESLSKETNGTSYSGTIWEGVGERLERGWFALYLYTILVERYCYPEPMSER